jgi:nickel transport protein
MEGDMNFALWLWRVIAGKKTAGAVACWGILFLWLEGVQAHSVTIFAWVEGDTVFSESKFSGGKKVKGGTVAVYDGKGDKLLEGRTNDDGEFSFNIPKKTEMKLVLQAGMGHRAEWTVPLEEIQPFSEKEADRSIVRQSAVEAPHLTDSGLSASEALKGRAAFDRTLEKKLDLIIKKLEEMKHRRPGFSDILGGIGYIFGLVGTAAYFHYRRKN